MRSACGFDNHLRRQLPDRQEQQTEETRMNFLAEGSLICQPDESAPHQVRCCANTADDLLMEKEREKKRGYASVCEEQERERILFPQTFLGCSSVICPCIEGRDDKNPTKKKIKSETER